MCGKALPLSATIAPRTTIASTTVAPTATVGTLRNVLYAAPVDVILVKGFAVELPTSHRVGAIVHDGAADLRLWKGPGVDRDLAFAWGSVPGLQEALDAQRPAVPGADDDEPPLGQVARVHPGKLHCDFLAWVGTRPPEPGTERQPAPDADRLRSAVDAVLRYVAERSVDKVAFPLLGEGPGALEAVDRAVLLVEAAHRYEDECFREGRAPVVEEVMVCVPDPAVLAAARRRVSRLARTAAPEPPKAEASDDKPRRRTARKAGTGARKSRAPAKPQLDPAEVERARLGAPAYDRFQTYEAGAWLIHPKFGVGRVEEVDGPGGSVRILFEDGAEKRLIHARSAS